MTPPTDAELQAVAPGFPKDAHLGITGVSHTQFSIARHYGGIELNGHKYTYFAEVDELWRDDFLKAVAKHRKANKKPVEKWNEKLFPDLHP